MTEQAARTVIARTPDPIRGPKQSRIALWLTRKSSNEKEATKKEWRLFTPLVVGMACCGSMLDCRARSRGLAMTDSRGSGGAGEAGTRLALVERSCAPCRKR